MTLGQVSPPLLPMNDRAKRDTRAHHGTGALALHQTSIGTSCVFTRAHHCPLQCSGDCTKRAHYGEGALLSLLA